MNRPEERSCCAPPRTSAAPVAVPANLGPHPSAATAGPTPTVSLPGGEFLMGTDGPDAITGDAEGPMRPVTVDGFRIAPHAVTNADFAAFVDATGHLSEAERFGWSYVFASFLPGHLRKESPRPDQTPWWCGVQGATWQAPEGPGSSVDDRADHPVVHVSWNDAAAYCVWAGVRLPTEAEWEYAARGGLQQARYAWGDELTPDDDHRCNIWQGRFPTKNTVEDGYRGTCPVDAFPPNGYGLHNVAGNVWEWCADWWGTEHSSDRCVNPSGPAAGPAKVIRGGSYLCHASYCSRYRVAARTANTPDSTTGNMGFRVAADT